MLSNKIYSLRRRSGLSQEQLMKRLSDAKVFVNDGATFGTGGDGHIRFNLACPTSAIEEAMDRLANS